MKIFCLCNLLARPLKRFFFLSHSSVVCLESVFSQHKYVKSIFSCSFVHLLHILLHMSQKLMSKHICFWIAKISFTLSFWRKRGYFFLPSGKILKELSMVWRIIFKCQGKRWICLQAAFLSSHMSEPWHRGALNQAFVKSDWAVITPSQCCAEIAQIWFY